MKIGTKAWTLGTALVFGVLLVASPGIAPQYGAHAATLPVLSVAGNHLVDANGTVVVLHGVDRSGTEYMCIHNKGIFDGPNTLNDDSQVPLMKNWGVNEALIGLNEDCWLGINGVSTAYAGANYINAIKHEVATLESYGIYPVIPLFWEAPGTSQATDQIAMPDNDHAPALWQSVANTFKTDPDVIFRLKEEPYPEGDTDGAAAWQCWKNGDVQYDTSNTLVPVSQIANCTEKYKTVGMQSLINIIRGTGATNIIQVPGAQYANSMTHFLDSAYRVSDTLATPQLMGVVDVYPNGNVCGSVTCYSSEYAPVISQMPFMAGEFGQSVSGRDCTTTGVDALMAWFDQQGAGYSAWDWDTWGQCLQLITDYTTGAPNGTWGNDYKNHLASLGGTGGSGQTPDFSLSASPSSQTVGRAGGSATYTISVAEKNGFQGQVTLSASGQPALSMASFSPNPTTSSSTLTVSVPARAHHGTFTITITGTSGTLSHTATTSLTVSNH